MGRGSLMGRGALTGGGELTGTGVFIGRGGLMGAGGFIGPGPLSGDRGGTGRSGIRKGMAVLVLLDGRLSAVSPVGQNWQIE